MRSALDAGIASPSDGLTAQVQITAHRKGRIQDAALQFNDFGRSIYLKRRYGALPFDTLLTGMTPALTG
jgi:hypothetical protein